MENRELVGIEAKPRAEPRAAQIRADFARAEKDVQTVLKLSGKLILGF